MYVRRRRRRNIRSTAAKEEIERRKKQIVGGLSNLNGALRVVGWLVWFGVIVIKVDDFHRYSLLLRQKYILISNINFILI